MAPKGQEIILGQLRDPVFGPVIAVGLGGVSVELLGDLSHRIAPIGYDDARDMLSELKVAPLFRGFRGRPPLDVEAMCDLIVRLSALATDFENEIEEVDLNPIVLLEEGKGARVVDALVVAGARP
jgi:acetyltransferase